MNPGPWKTEGKGSEDQFIWYAFCLFITGIEYLLNAEEPWPFVGRSHKKESFSSSDESHP